MPRYASSAAATASECAWPRKAQSTTSSKTPTPPGTWLTTASAVAAEKMAANAAKPIGIGGSRTHSAMAAAKSRIDVNASWLAASGLLGGTKEKPPIRMGPRNPKTKKYADDATAAAATTRRTD